MSRGFDRFFHYSCLMSCQLGCRWKIGFYGTRILLIITDYLYCVQVDEMRTEIFLVLEEYSFRIEWKGNEISRHSSLFLIIEVGQSQNLGFNDHRSTEQSAVNSSEVCFGLVWFHLFICSLTSFMVLGFSYYWKWWRSTIYNLFHYLKQLDFFPTTVHLYACLYVCNICSKYMRYL